MAGPANNVNRGQGFRGEEKVLKYRAKQDLEEGRAVHLDDSTGYADYAFDESNVDAIVRYATREGEYVTVISLNESEESFIAAVKDQGSAGDYLYLDVQADQASATGYLKFDGGGQSVPLVIAREAVAYTPESSVAIAVRNLFTPKNKVELGKTALQTIRGETDLSTTGDTTTLTDQLNGKTILGISFIVSEAITGLDSADHHIQIGIAADPDKYIDKANGSAATSIAKNTKDVYDFDPDNGVNATDLIATITGGTDQTPDAGTIIWEASYVKNTNFDDIA